MYQINLVVHSDISRLFRHTEAIEQHCSFMRLDHRRLELAHLKYALLMTQKRYARVATTLPTRIPMHTDLAETLEVYTPLYYKAFTQKYSGMCMMFKCIPL